MYRNEIIIVGDSRDPAGADQRRQKITVDVKVFDFYLEVNEILENIRFTAFSGISLALLASLLAKVLF